MPYDRSRPTGPPDPGQTPGSTRPWRPYRPQDDAGIAALTRSADRARIVTTTAILAAAVAAGLLVPRSAAAEPAAPPAHPVAARAVYADAAVLDAGDDGAVPAGTPAPPAAPAPEVSQPAGPVSTPPVTPPAQPSTAPTEPEPPTGAASAPSDAEKAQRKAERKAERKAKRKAERKAARKAERKAERKAQRKAERKAARKAERKAQRKAARKAAKKTQRSSGDVTMTGAVRSSRAARERVSLADWRASDHARMIVWRESNGRCDVVSSNGLWRGCWQMTMTLWRGNGGLAYASSPDRASCAEQDKVAYKVWLSSWWGPWGG